MEDSLLYDILYDRYCDFHEQLRNEQSFWGDKVKEMQTTFENLFNKEQLDVLEKYKRDIILWQEGIETKFTIKLLNIGVMIGMQLQRALDEESGQ